MPDIKLKYSKPSGFYLDAKKDFFSENTDLLKDASNKNRLYAQQPSRAACKICDSTLPSSIDFCSHGVSYVFCSQCTHLNGKHEDTKVFVEGLYMSNGGEDYSKNYVDPNYTQRVNNIYSPKVQFLMESMPYPVKRILDIGCGGGYFVFASIAADIDAEGIDVSETMVDFGNQHLLDRFGHPHLTCVDEDNFFDSIKSSNADVVSAIGVIEHLRDPRRFFKAFQESDVSYLYYSVPMFSFSVILENVFKDVFPRQLSGGHTHLFSEGSIKAMHEALLVESVAEWRFGTDVMDLYRSLMTSLQNNSCSKTLLDFAATGFGAHIDGLQSVFDQNHFCSEIHCLVKKQKK